MTSPGDNNEADAGSGGAGAPPDTQEPNRVYSDLTREYTTAGIRVQWFASRCIHSGACIRALPHVFDPRRRPWIDLAGADADAIANAVLKCPTGALHYQRPDGTPEPAPEQVTVVAVRNGPYLVTGPVEVTEPGGRVLRKDSRMALCRCGKSRHMPFCDNTHRATGFRTD